MSSAGGPLPSSDGTSKKAHILKLAAAGRPNREIASEVGASLEYVAKVKSEAKRRAMQGHAPTFLPSSRPAASGGSGSSTKVAIHYPAASILGARDQTSIISLKETDENAAVRKELWKKFSDNIPVVEIIRETGLNPHVVWSEFEYFLILTKRDPYTLQKEAMDYLSTRISEVPELEELVEPYQKLAENYRTNRYLTNTEFSELLRLLSRCNMRKGYKSGYESGIDAVASTGVRPPRGWVKPPCSICGKPMWGLVVNPSIEIGRTALASVRRYHHRECATRNEPGTT
jgi:hypothetical protein